MTTVRVDPDAGPREPPGPDDHPAAAAALVACAPEPMLVCDREGRVVRVNEAASGLLGVGAGERLERALGRIASADEVRRALEWLRQVVEQGIARSAQLDLQSPSGEPVPVRLSLSALRDAGGAVVGAVGILHDEREARAQRSTLERRAYTLERIVEERTRELRRANQARDEFLAVLSHELRTPLTPILTWAQILKREAHAGRARQAGEVIERNVRLQISLVENLLDLTRITEGTLPLDRQRHDLRAIVGAALGTVTEMAGEKGVQLEWTPPGLTVPAEVDAARIGQALVSILANAVKFSHEGGRVRVTLGREREVAVVRVRDDGAGIQPEFLPFVFEAFHQEEGARRRYGGLGVGLVLAKRLVDLHGGGLEVRSDGVGRGTEVTVRLSADEQRTDEPEGEPATGPADRLGGVRILLVEDSADAADATRLLLEGFGARVTLVTNGLDALGALARADVDAILCDLRMPGLDGFEFLRRLRRDPARGRVPVVAVSAFARAVDFQRTREAGFDGHVSKPFDCATLLLALRRAISSSAARPR